MTEIKPVYQVQQLGEWIEVDKSIFDEIYIQNKFPHRILYPAAAYEALQAKIKELEGKELIKSAAEAARKNWALHEKVEALQKENAELKEINDSLHRSSQFTYECQKKSIADLKQENAAQAKRIAELEETNGLLQTQVHCLEMVAASKDE